MTDFPSSAGTISAAPAVPPDALDAAATIVESNGCALGIAVRDAHRFRFHAADERLRTLEGKLFASLQHLRQAAIARALGRSNRKRRTS